MSIDGIYEIVEMELWDKDAIDLAETGFINIKGKKGKLHFICVYGEMDIQKLKDRYLFTWDGNDESDSASGYGEFTCSGDTLTGRIHIHDSDDSSFIAVKVPPVNKLSKIVNRGVLVVKAKEPFREWISLLHVPDEITIKEINDDCTAYLIPEFEDYHERDRILKKIYSDIFVEQLFGWCIDDNRWPKKRTLTLFKRWFALEFHSVVEDLGNEQLEIGDY